MIDLRTLLADTLVPVPRPSLATRLTSSRATAYRWEALDTRGRLLGTLDGVQDGRLSWHGAQAVQGSGSVAVTDVEKAKGGRLRIADVPLSAVRLRPWLVLSDPDTRETWLEWPLGSFVPSSPSRKWTATGRTFGIDLLDKATVLDQDKLAATFTCAASTPLLSAVRQVIEAAGETVTVDAPSDARPRAAIHWPAGTSRLAVVNDLLDLAGFRPLWVDGLGRFRASPHVPLSERPSTFDVAQDIEREFVDGEASIFVPEWTQDADLHGIPNRVLGVSAGTPTLTAVAENNNPDSPWSIPSRGRVITHVMSGVEVPATNPGAALFAAVQRELVRLSAPTSHVNLSHLPVPLRPGDAVRFRHTPAGVDGRHIVTETSLDCHPTGLASTTLAEVPRV